MRSDADIPHLRADDWDYIITPVSSGKDSQLVLRLALNTPGVRQKLLVVHQRTGYDHSLVYSHLDYMRQRYTVEIESTTSHRFTDIFDLIRKERYFPSSLARNCTSIMKIQPFARWLHASGFAHMRTLVLLGMRGPESQNRAKQYGDLEPSDMFSICDISKDYPKRLKAIEVNLPIVQWSTAEVFASLAQFGDEVNPLYKRGHRRVGCYPCLLSGNDEWRLAARDPEGRAHIQTLIDIEDDLALNRGTRKLIKIHPERDVRALLKGEADPFGLNGEDDGPECGHCNF